MKDEIKSLTDKIPDVWFDWYGRLIPGCIGIIIYISIFRDNYEFLFKNFLKLLFLAYLIGHIFQPFSSGLINFWMKDISKRKTKIVSKSYAELVGFISILIIALVLLILYIIKNTWLKLYDFLKTDYILLILLLILSLITVLLRRKALLRKLSQTEIKQ